MPKHTLMAHQVEGVKHLDRVQGVGALLWDPGCGKTGATAAWLDRLADRIGEVRVLVVAPLTAADTWVLQPRDFMDSPLKARLMEGRTADILAKLPKAKQWAGVPNAKVSSDHGGTRAKQVSGNRVTILSLSAGAVSSWCCNAAQKARMLRAVRAYAPHVIVVDESHIIKAHDSNVSKAMYLLAPLAKHRIILTGTVSSHSPLDVYGQWRFMAPWTFSSQAREPFTKNPLRMTTADWRSIQPWSWEAFQNRYSLPGGYKGAGARKYDPVMLQDLHDRVAERAHAVKKEDALDLPPVNDVEVHVKLGAVEEKTYRQMRDELAAEIASGEIVEAPNVLAKLMKLRQITGGFLRDTEAEETHVIGASKRRAVKDVVETQLANEQRIVVFAYFTSECQMLADMLRKKGVTVEVITGATPKPERRAIRERFGDVSGNPQRTILVAQARTMSISVNELVTAQHAVFASLSERATDWIQSRGRLDRIGQKGAKVTFWTCYVPGSIDEVILNNHETSGNLEQELLAHIQSTAGQAL